MQQYFKRRLLTLVPVILGVVVAVFLIIHLIPGDPLAMMLEENGKPADGLTCRLGLDKPLWVEYYRFWGNLFQGDLGESIYQRQPVFQLIMERFPNTVLLAVHLHWLPVTGMGSWKHLMLPSFTLGFGLSAITIRMIRSSMIEVINQDYIRTAFAKGLSKKRVVWKHAIKNVMIPVITIVGLQLGVLFGGVIIAEKVFSYPGIGSLLITAIKGRDYPLVQGVILIIALTYILINLLIDLIYSRVDPRIRLE
jgi:peptide/nickel transport system permease protein